MPKSLLIMAVALLATLAVAQDNAEPAADAGVTSQQDAADAAESAADSLESDIDPELFEDTELDEQTYEEDEDEFIPTEEIPADEPIPFPTNI